MINIVLLTSPDPEEYNNWQIKKELKGTIYCKPFVSSDTSLYILPCPSTYLEIRYWEILCATIESPHVFIHFGGARTGADIRSEIKKLFKDPVNIPTLSYYSLGQKPDGYPDGISEIYTKVKNELTTEKEKREALQQLFDLFYKEAIKKKHDDRIDAIADTQLHISSWIMLKSIDDKNKNINDKLTEIEGKITELVNNNNDAKEFKDFKDFEELHLKLEELKNNLIDERNSFK